MAGFLFGRVRELAFCLVFILGSRGDGLAEFEGRFGVVVYG